MTLLKPSLFAAALILALPEGMALAAPPTVAGTPAASFGSLPPDAQKIAHALFLAQQPTAGGPPVLSLDQIAALSRGRGWRSVFAQMKRDGLMPAASLADVVRGDERHRRGSGVQYNSQPFAVLMTSGNGRMIAAAREPDRVADDGRAGPLAVAVAESRGESTAARQ